jgi:hypothetical protein
MVKIDFNYNERPDTDNTKLSYPRLMESWVGNEIVLFVKKDGKFEGIILVSQKGSANKIGDSSIHYDLSCFRDFEGTVEISNDNEQEKERAKATEGVE